MKARPNAESFRIRALAYLVSKDSVKARLAILKALELEPYWESVRLAAATINYFSALSPAVLPDRLVPWPEPVDWAWVKRDDESVARLREAANVFREMAEEPANPPGLRQALQSWHLACLANDPERQQEATEYCQAILRDDPTCHRAISWAVARNYAIDLEPSETALRTLISDGSATIPHIIALVTCYLTSQRVEKGIKLLKRTRTKFREHEADELWTFWCAQSMVANGDPQAALTAIDASEAAERLRDARTLALRAIAEETGDSQQLIEHLERNYEQTKNPSLLWESCRLMAQQQNWSYVAERAELLVNEIGTSEAVRLAAIAAYNTERFELCLKLLDSHRGLFGQRRLPGGLRRVRVVCLQALGALPQAIAEAEAHAREEPSTENLLALAGLYTEVGDLRALALVARQLADQPDVTAEESLRIAGIVHFGDRELAIRLWTKAVSRDLPDGVVGPAVALGFQLGLDEQLGPLLRRVAELSAQGRGGIQSGTIDELIPRLRQYRRQIDELQKAYRNAELPIQVIAEQANWSLADLYHNGLLENEAAADPLRRPALLIRHGGRALVSGFPDSVPAWRLHLDVTAILLATHLDILANVELAFKPLRIPPNLVLALVGMRDRAAPPQPSRLHDCRQILDLVELGAIEVVKAALPEGYANTQLLQELGEEWVSQFEDARTSEGYLVDFLPLTKQDLSGPPLALPADAREHLVNCCAVIESLRERGPLSQSDYARALRRLGDEGRQPVRESLPEQGSPLFCVGSTAEALARANVLPVVCERFHVRFEQRELERVRAEAKRHEQMASLAAWLGALIERLRQGIGDGIYEIIAGPSVPKDTAQRVPTEVPEVGCLRTLLGFQAKPGDVIWADDRYINSYGYGGSAPIVGVNEVLKSLVSAGALGVGDYYSKVSRLRAANARFVPLQKDEILHHLRQANVDNGRVVETQELRVLRRYVAACLVQGELLQRPATTREARNRHGEVPFVIGLGRAISDALVGIWADRESDESVLRARADWLVDSVYLSHLALFSVTSLPGPQQDDRYLVALSLAALISQAITLPSSPIPEQPCARRRYLDWLWDRILWKRVDADPRLVLTIADVLKRSLASAWEATLSDCPKAVARRIVQQFYEDLPKPVREELARDSDFLASIGLRLTISVHGLPFDPEEFWRAAREAVNGREATTVPVGMDTEVAFQPLDDGHGRRFFFSDPVTDERRIVDWEELELLCDSAIERDNALRRHRDWFDCSNEVFDRVVAEIVSMQEPHRSIQEIDRWRDSSAAKYYSDLYWKLKERRKFQVADLVPPSADGLLRHYRLNPDCEEAEAFREALSLAAQTLINEEGLSRALDCFLGLPVPLPAVIVGNIADLSPENRRTLIKRLLGTAGSPISKTHLLHLLLHFGDRGSAFHRLARWLIGSLFSTEAAKEFEAFLAILKWVNDEFSQWQDTRTWRGHVRLAMVWAHAHRLFTTYSSLHAPASWVRDTFDRLMQRVPLEVFERDPDCWFDIAHPRQISRVVLLLAAVSYALGERSEGFVDKELQDLFIASAFSEIDGRRLPVPPLLRDPTQARDSLCSFVGGDRGKRLSPLLGRESAAVFTRSQLQELVERSVDALAETSESLLPWSLLGAVLGDLLPRDDLRCKLRGVFRQTDFLALSENSADLGYRAIHVACLQAMNLADEDLRHYLRSQLVELARQLSDRELIETNAGFVVSADSVQVQERLLLLGEAALNLSVANRTPQEASAEFANLLADLLEVCPSMAMSVRLVVKRLSDELPIAQARHFWPLLVRLRAE